MIRVRKETWFTTLSVMVHNNIIPCAIWYRILGHLHYKVLSGLQKIVKGMPVFDFEHDSVYRDCTLGNNVKKSFSGSSTRSKGILELIHFDVCGPMSSPSLSGYLYYVLFIDGFYRNSYS